MGTYRKKPVVVEAFQWFKNGDHPEDHSDDIHRTASVEGTVVRYFRDPTLSDNTYCKQCKQGLDKWVLLSEHGWIDTLEGGHRVCPGDYIITGVQGERYPCKPDIFEATYEKVTD